MNLDEIYNSVIDDRTKGVPGGTAPFKLKDIKQKKWNLLEEDLPFPLMVIKQANMEQNAIIFRDYLQTHGVSLAPHGKTTMCPQIFKQQLDDGAWGMTAATVNQIQVYRRYGVQRTILANQLLGDSHIRYIVDELNDDTEFDFYCLVDSLAQLELLQTSLKKCKPQRPLNVFVEMGCSGGRTGFRDDAQAMQAVEKINACADTTLAGIEAFEGVLPDSGKVTDFLNRIKGFVEKLAKTDFDFGDEFIVSAGGTAYFDLVISIFKTIDCPKPLRIIIRSGCYLNYDSGAYHHALEIAEKEKRAVPKNLQPSIEVWAYVQSIPEKGQAILSMGKRDCPYDAGFPTVEKHYRKGEGFLDCAQNRFEITAVNDQHAFLSFDSAIDLRVGDILGAGISHPCTAFDKWKFIPVVDDGYNVINHTFLTFFLLKYCN